MLKTILIVRLFYYVKDSFIELSKTPEGIFKICSMVGGLLFFIFLLWRAVKWSRKKTYQTYTDI
jgi:hypothetical protein